MNISEQIQHYIASQIGTKASDLQVLHNRMLQLFPNSTLWFLDGKDSTGKVVSNPNIGYGQLTINYADGSSKEFYRIGISANTTGISVYIMGIQDKDYLPLTYGKTLGRAKVTGYCIKFKKLEDIDIEKLESAMRDGFEKAL